MVHRDSSYVENYFPIPIYVTPVERTEDFINYTLKLRGKAYWRCWMYGGSWDWNNGLTAYDVVFIVSRCSMYRII